MGRAEVQDADRADVAQFIERLWGSPVIVSAGQVYRPHEERGILERRNGRIVGLLTYRLDGNEIQALTLNSTIGGERIGTSLLLELIEMARRCGHTRVWLTTTNDNMRAIGLYQRLGFRIIAVNVGAADDARRIKPQIPEVGESGIPIHDEIVMELRVQPYLDAAPARSGSE